MVITKLFIQHVDFCVRNWLSINIANTWSHLPSTVVNEPSVIYFEKRLDLLKNFHKLITFQIKFDLSCTEFITRANIGFDG